MAKVRPGRRIERAGVNALRTLLEEHDHLVQEIDGGIDHGEDLFVLFVRGGRRTGHVIAIQVKSGEKYKRRNGYAIPVENHAEDWMRSRLPVVGVVYDKEKRRLFWVNLSKELHSGNESPWIKVSGDQELTNKTIKGFVADLEQYVDTNGMRVKGATSAQDLAERVRAARLGRDLIDPTKGADLPNTAFVGMADFFEKHPRIRRIKPMRVAFYLLIASGMIFEWQLQNKFAAAYVPEMPSWLYVFNMYNMMVILMIANASERRANRHARGVRTFLFYVIWYYWTLPFQMADDPSTDQWWGKMWGVPMAIGPAMVITFTISWYVRAELDRRKRLASAG